MLTLGGGRRRWGRRNGCLRRLRVEKAADVFHGVAEQHRFGGEDRVASMRDNYQAIFLSRPVSGVAALLCANAGAALRDVRANRQAAAAFFRALAPELLLRRALNPE
jgi:hypothetical protein